MNIFRYCIRNDIFTNTYEYRVGYIITAYNTNVTTNSSTLISTPLYNYEINTYIITINDYFHISTIVYLVIQNNIILSLTSNNSNIIQYKLNLNLNS